MAEINAQRHKALRKRILNLRQLQYILAANDCGSIRRAADLLYVRHSAMSRSIRELESTLGVSLFDRTSSGVRPTIAAQRVLRIARLVIEQLDALVETGRKTRPDEVDRVSIGFCTSTSAGTLRATLLEFRRQFPGLGMSLEEQSRTRLVDALRSRKIDIIVRPGGPSSAETVVLPLWSERLFVSLPEKHVLANQGAVCWADLREETILLGQHTPCPELHGFPMSALSASEGSPAIERHNAGRGVIESLVGLGFGVSLALESDVSLHPAGVTFRELRNGSTTSQVSFSAEWRPDNDNPALRHLLRLLKERYSTRPPRSAGV